VLEATEHDSIVDESPAGTSPEPALDTPEGTS
jgi:hypothetical protein